MTTAPHIAITGGTRGIGFAVAQRFAAQGAQLSILYRRQRKQAQIARDALIQAGAQAVHLYRGDVADRPTVESWIAEAVEFHGPIHSLIVNAASGAMRPLQELDDKAWEWTMKINHLGALISMQSARAHMDQGACIVALSSLGSIRAIPDYTLVGSSKAALEVLVRQAAYEWGPEGIRVNGVSGGAVDTDAIRHFPQAEAVLEASQKSSLTGFALTVDHIASAVVWLCSPDSAGIQGQTLVVDVGHSIGLPTQQMRTLSTDVDNAVDK